MRHTHQHGNLRPSAKEAAKKVQDALAALREGNRNVALDKHLAMSMSFLGVGSTSEMWEAITELLEELEALGPEDHYVGGHPPQKSYETKFTNDELWAYRWKSTLTKRETYLKFVLKKGWFFFFDCHEHKKPKN